MCDVCVCLCFVWCTIGMSPLRSRLVRRTANAKTNKNHSDRCFSKCWMAFANERQWPVVPFELQHSFHAYAMYMRADCVVSDSLKWHGIESNWWWTGELSYNRISSHWSFDVYMLLTWHTYGRPSQLIAPRARARASQCHIRVEPVRN